jgi:hypothetical protein
MATIAYKKEYLPGYTGHVPQKNAIFGCTAGDINKIIAQKITKPSNIDIENATETDNLPQRTFYSKPPSMDLKAEKLPIGNNSRVGRNWVGGPTNNIKAQHIPGYQGYVPNVKAENLLGKSYARVTGQAINKEFVQGNDIPVTQRFAS